MYFMFTGIFLCVWHWATQIYTQYNFCSLQEPYEVNIVNVHVCFVGMSVLQMKRLRTNCLAVMNR